MANYFGVARSNYFHLKDDAARARLAHLAETHGLEVVSDNDARVALLCRTDEGTWPTSYWDEDADEDVEIDLPQAVAALLADGEVAIFMEIGFEKMRYLSGYAVAINNNNERRVIHLDDIYEVAKDLGSTITPATY